MTSYVNTRLGLFDRVQELFSLYSGQDAEPQVRAVLKQARDMEAKLVELSGRPLWGGTILEVGAGQKLIQLNYFSTRAGQAMGIDTDVVPSHVSPAEYVKMWRVNGSLRTFKTMARQLLGIDARIRRELERQLGIALPPRPPVFHMDASAMIFADASLDFIYSRAVFEHLSDPRSVLREIRRVLKPGGAVVIYLHLYTSDTGCHDARVFAAQRAHIPYWGHLRPAYAKRVCENAYLNHLRLEQWRQLFDSEMPGGTVVGHCDSDRPTRQALTELRAKGELSEYTDEELLSITVEANWVKPSAVA